MWTNRGFVIVDPEKGYVKQGEMFYSFPIVLLPYRIEASFRFKIPLEEEEDPVTGLFYNYKTASPRYYFGSNKEKVNHVCLWSVVTDGFFFYAIEASKADMNRKNVFYEHHKQDILRSGRLISPKYSIEVLTKKDEIIPEGHFRFSIIEEMSCHFVKGKYGNFTNATIRKKNNREDFSAALVFCHYERKYGVVPMPLLVKI